MSRTVRSFLPVTGDPDALGRAFDGDPTRWLPGASRGGPNRVNFQVRAGSLSRVVDAYVGRPWHAGATCWRSLAWDPDGHEAASDRLLPSLDGELGLHVTSGGRVTLILDARYRAPGGALGRAADSVALGRIAERTIDQLLTDVAARLSAEALLAEGSPSRNTPRHHRAGAVRT